MGRILLGILLAIVLIVGITVGVLYYTITSSIQPDVSDYKYLEEPQINNLPDQNMLVIEAYGDPNTNAAKAFEILIATYFRFSEIQQMGFQPILPRGRYPVDIYSNPSDWLVSYAIPIPENIGAVPPAVDVPDDFSFKVEVWEYGPTAEILHYGAYEDEAPTIERLMNFIEEQGYRVIGDHEEIYLVGPESGKSPSDYVTILRYRVQPVESGE